jgi:phosphatidyl-myo-inositol dimannoside synthase
VANVLFVCDTFPPNVGGSEHLLLAYARAAQQAGDAVIVMCPASSQPADAEAAFDAAEPYLILRSRVWRRLFRMGGSRWGVASRLARVAIVLLLFWKLLRIRGVEVIVVGHLLPAGNVVAAVRKLRRRVRAIAVVYGEEIGMYARGARMRGMMLTAIDACNVIRCLTNHTRAQLVELNPALEPRIRVQPPPAQMQAPDPAQVEQLRASLGVGATPVLLTVGRLVPRKGVDVTIRALGILGDEFPDLRYVVVGEGPYRGELEQLAAKLGVTGRVLFTGAVAGVTPYFGLCDVFVMPNRRMYSGEEEGYGIVFLEAGIAGKPVIGGRSGGASEAVIDGSTGILVDPLDPSAVADAIRRLLNDSALRARVGEANRRHALEISDPDAVRASVEALLQDALSHARG